MDSKRDQDLLEAVIARITSVKNVVSMKGRQFKGSVSGHQTTLDMKLKQFKALKVNSQTVRNDMTVSQQHAPFKCKIKKRKGEELVAEGRVSLASKLHRIRIWLGGPNSPMRRWLARGP